MKKEAIRILLVDDDRAINFLNKYIFKKAGYTHPIQVSENGQEALDIIALEIEESKTLPDLILLDVNMPCINGWEFLKEFKKFQFSQKAKIKIVILSSSTNPDDKRRAENTVEVSGFINKPLTPEKINNIFQEEINNSNMANYLFNTVFA